MANATHPIFQKILADFTRDPRESDPAKMGIFRDHNCWKCDSGARPCVAGSPNRCDYPHARND